MKGKLIVIEGLDGSGKGTQSKLLLTRLTKQLGSVKLISFPDYSSESSSLVKMYLSGKIGEADDINPYAATSFYSADRYISYKTNWKDFYKSGGAVIADRYTTSNIIYQMTKLPKENWQEYINWIEDFEYQKQQLPKPDVVIYLDVDIDLSQSLLKQRYDGNDEKKDIHEKNLSFLYKCRETGLYAAKHLGWHLIEASPKGKMLSVEEISAKIDTILKEEKIY